MAHWLRCAAEAMHVGSIPATVATFQMEVKQEGTWVLRFRDMLGIPWW